MVEALHLYKREELARRQLETIFEISQAISASLDLEQTLPVIGRSLTRALALPTCAHLSVRRGAPGAGAEGGVRRRGHRRAEREARRRPVDVEAIRRAFYRYVFPIDEPYGAHLIQLRQPIVIDNPQESPFLPADFVRDIPFVAVMEVPLVVRDRLVGLAALPVWEGGQGFTERQLRLAMGIAQAAAVAIEHAQLYARARELGMAEERNRLAREVHDTLAQGLTAITLQLEAAERLMPPGAEAQRLVARGARRWRGARWPRPAGRSGGWRPRRWTAARWARRWPTRSAASGAGRAGRAALGARRGAATARRAGGGRAAGGAGGAAQRREARPGQPGAGGAGARQAGASGQLSFLVADDGMGFDPARGRARRPDGGGFGLTSMQRADAAGRRRAGRRERAGLGHAGARRSSHWTSRAAEPRRRAGRPTPSRSACCWWTITRWPARASVGCWTAATTWW